ncbi:hypothetical protein H4S07_002923 [Coemansia furcata]|uniref:Uncharacterized protein n=1 Tax=Coemansia furcata TaxID=417177 RepID=A0ACC1LI87_9FUNG|nr:hypothetical protein H4S07_002923 [Coemansia furcata]
MPLTTGKRSQSNSINKGVQQKSIDAFFKPKKQKVSDDTNADKTQDMQWREFGQTWLGKFGTPAPSTKFAAFDLDGTLIRTIGSCVHPQSSDDWRFYHPDVPKLLRNIHEQGYRVVIMSNQNGLVPRKGSTELSTRARDFRLKLSKIAQQLEIPFTIFAAIGKDFMRKPSPGMWHMAELDNEGVVVDKALSFYVGDAAGRPAGWKRGVAKDHSDSDLAFALNAGVAFYTPEEIITAEICARSEPLPPPPPRVWPLGRFSPKSLSFDNDGHSALIECLEADVRAATEQKNGLLVLLVGPPACGKSTFAAVHLAPLGFECVNMDTLGTPKKCINAVKEALEAGRFVVVDNTNPDPKSRGSFINIANRAGANSVAVVFEHQSRDLALHNNQYRSKLEQARFFYKSAQPASLCNMPVGVARVPDVAYHSYFKRFELPTEGEGIAKILHHSFAPSFDCPDDEGLWNQYH